MTVFGLVWFSLANLARMDEFVRLAELAKLAKIGYVRPNVAKLCYFWLDLAEFS